MNSRLLLSIFLLFALISYLISSVYKIHTFDSIGAQIQQQRLDGLDNRASVLAQYMRNDLILWNISAAETIIRVTEQNIVSYEIISEDKGTLRKVVLQDLPSHAFSKDIYYSDENKQKWGSIVLHYSRDESQETLSRIEETLNNNFIIVLVFNISIISLLIFSIWASGLSLKQVIRSYLLADSLGRPSRFAMYAWGPVISALRSSIERYKDLKQIAGNAEMAHAVARTVQMLAHDVRKPFSITKSGIQLLGSVRSSEEIAQILPQLQNEVDRSLSSVNNMIEDIMEVGKKTYLEKEPTSPVQVVQRSLEEIGHMYGDCQINITVDWGHIHKVLVDTQKIKRVFSNILANACQAMRFKGDVWIKTLESADSITFILGNNGSFIPAEDCEKLFEAFYTKGKRGGTGLGLAIVKKISEAHGGKVSVRSDTETQVVEFSVTLPTVKELDDEKRPVLPSKLSDYRVLRVPMTEIPTAPNKEFVAKIQDRVQTLGRKLNIAIIDDEPLYRKAVAKLAVYKPLSDLLEFREFERPLEFLGSDVSELDFVISDVDLEDQNFNGYDIVSKLRDTYPFLPICIHSNKTLAQDFRKAIEVGASTVLPKPLTLEHLLKFLVDGLL